MSLGEMQISYVIVFGWKNSPNDTISAIFDREHAVNEDTDFYWKDILHFL